MKITVYKRVGKDYIEAQKIKVIKENLVIDPRIKEFAESEFVRFRSEYSEAYDLNSKGKVNTRFEALTFMNPEYVPHRTFKHLYAKLTWWEYQQLQWLEGSHWFKNPQNLLSFTNMLLALLLVWLTAYQACSATSNKEADKKTQNCRNTQPQNSVTTTIRTTTIIPITHDSLPSK